jgi:hypothetical protein
MTGGGIRRFGSACLALVAAGCADLLLPPDPDDGPEAVARALWTEVDEYYPYFELKGVNWAAVGDTFLARVTPSTSNAELFNTLSAMLLRLQDGHVSLESQFGIRAYDGWYAPYPENFDPTVVHRYVGPPAGAAARGAVTWGRLAPGIGYLSIRTFAGEGIGEAVDAALAALDPLDGLVVDVRSNGGGSDTQSEAAAGRFVDEPVAYRTVRYKTGPGHEDFGPEITSVLQPAGPRPYTGPAVVLQNRRVFSAAEDFVLAMRVRPNVTFIGDFTGGGLSNPIARELPNGWIARVPRWRLWAADGTGFEGVGLAPDELLGAPRLSFGQDAILERAVEVMKQSR